MAAQPTLTQAMRENLQAKVSQSSTIAMADLKAAFFTSFQKSRTDSIRDYLRTQTGLTTGARSTSDLWRQFFIGKGITNQASLGDMARDFFKTGTL